MFQREPGGTSHGGFKTEDVCKRSPKRLPLQGLIRIKTKLAPPEKRLWFS
jgi:hypothetical protein